MTLAAAMMVARPGSALSGEGGDVELARLAGWWIAVDDAVLALPWEGKSGQVEILLVDADGGAEDRYLLTNPPLISGDCLAWPSCSDAPLVARGRIAVSGSILSFDVADAPPGRIRDRETDERLRRASVAATRLWQARLEIGGDRLVLTPVAGGATRLFARIEPSRLARLRAGFYFLSTEFGDWPCFLATAMAGDAAFGLLAATGRQRPAELDPFLEAASYILRLVELEMMPTPDDPDTFFAQAASHRIELVISEGFDLDSPRRAADKAAIRARSAYVNALLEGRSAAEAQRHAAAADGGAPVTVPVGEPALAAFSQFRASRYDRDGAAAAAAGLACPRR